MMAPILDRKRLQDSKTAFVLMIRNYGKTSVQMSLLETVS
jgi:hypothetical protein